MVNGIRTRVITTGYDGAPGYNTFYGFEGQDSLLRTQVDALWTNMESLLANGTIWECNGDVETFDLATGQTNQIDAGVSFGGNGVWGTAKAPGGTTLVLRWRTGVYANGRELRGRSFISGLGDFGDSAGNVPATIVTDAQGAMGAYIAGAVAPAVYSPTNADLASITAISCWNKFGLMRSRRD